MREKKPQESLLADEFRASIDYLKQFLPNDDYIEYLAFDMAKHNKTYYNAIFLKFINFFNLSKSFILTDRDKENLMNKLNEIAEYILNKTKFFQNFTNEVISKE